MDQQKRNIKLKLLYLRQLFLTRTDEEHRLGVPEICKAMQDMGVTVERKSIYRDIDTLISYGMDIRLTQTGYYLASRDFENSELRLLVSAVQAASFISEARSQALVDKLLRLTSDAQAEAILKQTNIGGVKCAGDEIFRTIEMVNLAIANACRLSFFYIKQDISKRNVVQRSGKSYHVTPYAMIWMQDRYYLVANMNERNNLTHFRLDRIQNARLELVAGRPCGEVSEYAVRFDAADYAKKCVNMFGGEVIRITLRGEMRLVSDVLDRFGQDTVLQRDPGDDAHFLAYIQAANGVGFLSWAAQYGAALEILTPASLREEMRKRMLLTCALYEPSCAEAAAGVIMPSNGDDA
ncbi:MAG: WYL domain-containing protein [Clostridia bacterium]|nr:WYL domain-containing protein [Clostridia bacterium]